MENNLVHINIAKKEELPRVVELIMHLDSHYGFGDFPRAKEECVINSVYRAYHDAPCFVVKTDKGEIVGLSSLTLCDVGWTDENVLTPWVTYILQEHRKPATVKALYQAVKDYAKLQGVLLLDTHLAPDRVDARRKMLLSQGFKESGFVLTYRG